MSCDRCLRLIPVRGHPPPQSTWRSKRSLARTQCFASCPFNMVKYVSMCFNDLQCVFPPVGKAKHGKTMKTDTTGDSLRRVGRVPRRCGCGVCFGTTAVVWRTPICWTKSWRHANRRKRKTQILSPGIELG